MGEPTWKRAKDLLAEALDQPTADRAEFVRGQCSDPPVVAEVIALLQEFEEAPNFMETSPSIRDLRDTIVTDDPRLAEALEVIDAHASPLADLPVKALQALLSAMDPREYAVGERIINQGDPGDCLLLLLDGTAVARVRDMPSDRAPVGRFGPGDIVGEMSLITDEARTADVDACSAVRALSLSAGAFHRVSETHPDVRVLLTSVVADRLGQATHDGLGGKHIGGYRIVRCVGRGGMGVVYEASRLDTSQVVALKMMNHRLLYHPGAVRRFRREAATLETLDHPSIPRMYGSFEAYGTQFLAMEYCEGSTLNQLISRHGPIGEALVRRIVGQLAIALGYVHRQGIVHRDLKPSNVMVARSGMVLLLDFGIVTTDRPQVASRVADQLAPDSTVFVGTPRYMAPEQFAAGKSDHRVDYYGLACVAYEALSGRPAIDATDRFAVMRDKLKFKVPPASRIGAGVSEEMHELLTRGLDSAPENRVIDLQRLGAWAGPVELPASLRD